MTRNELEVLAVIQNYAPNSVAVGAIQECFHPVLSPSSIDYILSELEAMGFVTKETRPTIQGKTVFYSTTENAPEVNL